MDYDCLQDYQAQLERHYTDYDTDKAVVVKNGDRRQ